MPSIAPPPSATTQADGATEDVSEGPASDVEQVAADEGVLLREYYRTVLDQARTSFRWAVRGVGVGLLFFVCAVAVQISKGATNAAIISAIAGAVVEVISGLTFVLYGRTTIQLGEFHERLERTHRFMLANSICGSLTGDLREATRVELIRALATHDAGRPGDAELGRSLSTGRQPRRRRPHAAW